MAVKVYKVEFLAGPDDLSGPDNLERFITDFINRAEKRLYIAVQKLEGRQKCSPVKAMSKKGADLYGVKKANGVGKLHHKLKVLDGQVVIVRILVIMNTYSGHREH